MSGDGNRVYRETKTRGDIIKTGSAILTPVLLMMLWYFLSQELTNIKNNAKDIGNLTNAVSILTTQFSDHVFADQKSDQDYRSLLRDVENRLRNVEALSKRSEAPIPLKPLGYNRIPGSGG